jgi:hypothetical protein
VDLVMDCYRHTQRYPRVVDPTLSHKVTDLIQVSRDGSR